MQDTVWIQFRVEESRIHIWVTLTLTSGLGLRKIVKKICPVLSNNFPQIAFMLDLFPSGICHVTVTSHVCYIEDLT